MSPHRLDSPPKRAHLNPVGVSGFSLLELLAAVAIVGLLASLSVISLRGLNANQQINDAVSRIEGALKRARSHAIARQTYVWVGFFEKTPSDESSPAQTGTGEVLISIVASNNGTRLYTSDNSIPLDQNPDTLEQVCPILVLPNIHLDVIPVQMIARSHIAPDEFQIGHEAFAVRPLYSGSTRTMTNGITFSYPLGSAAGSQARFVRILQFAPNGDASKISSDTARLIEIGLRPAHAGQVLTDATPIALIQINGITGTLHTLRK